MRIFVPPNKQWFTRSENQKQSLDAKWKKFRAHVLKTYGRQCMACGTTKGAMQIDHIKPKSVYKSLWYEITNMQVLCRPCNFKKGRREIDYRRDWIIKNPTNPVAKRLMKKFLASLPDDIRAI
jgi:5-methylcytosine-specific restriction endonuclease McrA